MQELRCRDLPVQNNKHNEKNQNQLTNFDQLEQYIPQGRKVDEKSNNHYLNDKYLNLPQQIKPSPYEYIQKKVENRPFSGNLVREMRDMKNMRNFHFQSIDKCAVTEISSYEDAQDGLTICQKLFMDDNNTTYNNKNDNIMVTEATFKPDELKNHFKKKAEDGDILKKTIQKTLRPQSTQKLIKIPKQIKIRQINTKTKYEKILEDYFKKHSKSQNIIKTTNKMFQLQKQRIQSHQYEQKKSIQTSDHDTNKENINFNRFIQKNQLKFVETKMIKETNKIIKEPYLLRNRQMKKENQFLPLKETFSQNIKTEADQITRRSQNKQNSERNTERWMTLTFSERQRKTIQNKKNKIELGKIAQRETETQGCTFRPRLTEFKPKDRASEVSSYKAMYLQKIKKRL